MPEVLMPGDAGSITVTIKEYGYPVVRDGNYDYGDIGRRLIYYQDNFSGKCRNRNRTKDSLLLLPTKMGYYTSQRA